MQRKTIILLVTLSMLILWLVFGWPRLNFYMLTGRFTPIHKIETLQNPVIVSNWNSDGLHLVDGRTVQLERLRSLPSDSAALTEATKSGVEIQPDGRVWGLVRIHHWCGNDPVREHIARVDLARMMLFLRVGEPASDVTEAGFLAREPGGTFSEWGWHVEEFGRFQAWESMNNSTR